MRAIAMLLTVIFALGAFSHAAFAAEETLSYSTSTEEVTMSAQHTGTFNILIPQPEKPYAGIEFYLQTANGASISNVSYSEAGSTIPPKERVSGGGLYVFTLYTGTPKENIFSQALTCTVTVNYSGKTETQLTINKILQNTYTEYLDVDVLASPENAQTITIVPYISSEPPTPGSNSRGGGGRGAVLPPGEDIPSEPSIPDTPDISAEHSIKLDGSDGRAYVLGYPDKTFRPDANITRAEAASIFYSLVSDPKKANYKEKAAQFNDVGVDKWYSGAIGYLAQAGIISGYMDGSFRGDKEISRAEFVTMASMFSELNESGEPSFPDVAQTLWSYKFIRSAFNNKWISGYPDGTFRPDKKITRAESVAVVNKAISLDLSLYEGYPIKFNDVSMNMWYYTHILAASSDMQQ